MSIYEVFAYIILGVCLVVFVIAILQFILHLPSVELWRLKRTAAQMEKTHEEYRESLKRLEESLK